MKSNQLRAIRIKFKLKSNFEKNKSAHNNQLHCIGEINRLADTIE